MNLLAAVLLVLAVVLLARTLPIQNQVRKLYDLSREVLAVMGDDDRTDREKGTAIRTLSARLLSAFLIMNGTMALAFLTPAVGLLVVAETGMVSLSGVWDWLNRLDFQLVTLLMGAVWYLVRARSDGGLL